MRILTGIKRALLAVAALLPVAAHAQCLQTGPFTAFTQSWRGPGNTVGFFFPGAATMVVDADGDGNVNNDPGDRTYAVPPEIQTNRFVVNLSPTREFLMVIGGDPAGTCDIGRSVRTYRLDPAGTVMHPVHTDCLPCTLFEGPLFYDMGAVPPNPFPPPVTPQRIMLLRTGAGPNCSPSNLATPYLRWYDLTTPGLTGMATTSMGLQPGTGQIRVSPSGYQALIQHDLTNNAADSDWTMINLCPGPDFGQPIGNQAGLPINDWDNFPLPVGVIAASSASDVTVQMTEGPGGPVIFQATVPNCCASGTDPMGACCVSGGCVMTVQSQCSGTWNPGVACQDADCPPPPVAVLSVTMTGPASVVQRGMIDYVLTYSNTGGASASGVTVRDRLPNGVTFVSASDGGTYNSFTQQVTWPVGAVPAQSGPRTLTLRVQAGCFNFSYVNSIYAIAATGLPDVNGSPSVETLVTPETTGTITGSATTTPLSPPPLLPGARLRHQITLTNTSAVALTNFRLGSAFGQFGFGLGTVYGALVDAGSGTLTVDQSATSAIWIGSLNPGQTTDIIFETVVTDCIPPSMASTQLNLGFMFSAQTQCGFELGSFPPPAAVALQASVTATLQAINTQPGVIGPVAGGSPTHPGRVQFYRGTPTFDIELRVENSTGAEIAAAEFSMEFPFSWTTPDPPFAGPVPAGYSYDSISRTLSYAGPVPAGGLAPVVVRTTPPAGESASFSLMRSTSEGCRFQIGSLAFSYLPELPAGPLVIGVDSFSSAGLWTMRRGVDPLPTSYFRRMEHWHGMSKEPNGDIWLAGLPVSMINPITLDAAVPRGYSDFLRANSLIEVDTADLAIDPVDGTLVVLVEGRTQPGGVVIPPALIRCDLASGACSFISRDPALAPTIGNLAELLIDPAGTIYIANRTSLFRIPRSLPTPIPDGQVPIVTPPHPAYTFGPGAGTLASQRVHTIAWACNGSMIMMHASLFTGGTNPEGIAVDTTLYAISVYDLATNTIAVVQPQLAANANGMGYRQWPVEFSPQLPVEGVLLNSTMGEGEVGEVLVGNEWYPYHSIYAVNLADGATTAIVPAVQWRVISSAAIGYMQGGCGWGPSCDSIDFNGDGLFPDNQDLQDFLDVFGGGACPTGMCGDLDFNNDGLFPDNEDIVALFRVFGGGAC